jgi:hypothetical protein
MDRNGRRFKKGGRVMRCFVLALVLGAVGCFNPYARTGWEFRVHRPSTRVAGEVLSASGNTWVRDRIRETAEIDERATLAFPPPAPVLGAPYAAPVPQRVITREGYLLEQILLRLESLDCQLRLPPKSTQAAPPPRKCD